MSQSLVSCIMPTRGRLEFVRQAYRLWARQTWPETELIAVVDEDDLTTRAAVDEFSSADPRVRVVCVPAGTPLGEKRNSGAEAAAGEYVCHWDDDDYYAAQRIERQVEPLIAGVSEMNWTPLPYVLDLVARAGWFVPDQWSLPLSGTLMYERRLWGAARYPPWSRDEDTRFIELATGIEDTAGPFDCLLSDYEICRRWNARLAAGTGSKGARIRVVPGLAEQIVWVRHGRNTTRTEADGNVYTRQLWGYRRADPPIPDDEREFYRQMANALNAERQVA